LWPFSFFFLLRFRFCVSSSRVFLAPWPNFPRDQVFYFPDCIRETSACVFSLFSALACFLLFTHGFRNFSLLSPKPFLFSLSRPPFFFFFLPFTPSWRGVSDGWFFCPLAPLSMPPAVVPPFLSFPINLNFSPQTVCLPFRTAFLTHFRLLPHGFPH